MRSAILGLCTEQGGGNIPAWAAVHGIHKPVRPVQFGDGQGDELREHSGSNVKQVCSWRQRIQCVELTRDDSLHLFDEREMPQMEDAS